MTTITDALTGITKLAIDSVIFIYYLEENPTYIARVDEVFKRIDEGEIEGFTSTLTLTEVLVQPLRLGDSDLEERYRSRLLGSRHLHTLPVDAATAGRAASLRVDYRLRTPDALQIATALETGCNAFLTNDLGLRRITELPILVLDELES